ncbi:MAG: hypothetical protein JWP96_1868 [Polaromonas sp.]|nr:hypothetical protein [Polaromonas sp.]
MPMDDSPPKIEMRDTPEGPVVFLQGAWTAANLTVPTAWAALTAQLKSLGTQAAPAAAASGQAAKAVKALSSAVASGWSLAEIEKLDYLGAQVVWNEWNHRWPALLQLEPEQRAMLETVEKFTVRLAPSGKSPWTEPLLMLGARLLSLIDHAKGMLRLLGQLLLDVMRLVRRPHQGPWRDFSGHLYNFGATALPITALVGFLIGVVLAYLISQQLRQFGADAFIVNILGISLIRELGPVLAAILIAGRSGSAITAQIGVMRVTEELDAMRVMGIARGFRLVMPRAMALAVVMPLISVWTTLAALLGGMLAAVVSMNLTPSYFFNALPAAVNVSNLTLATAKSVVFGLLIALVGCHFGLRVKPNTESLGQGTTASVVTSITVVILVDALFAILFKSVGI